MLNTICIVLISAIVLLPFIIKFLFRFNDYYGFIMGVRYLIIACFCQFILSTVLPSTKKGESSDNKIDEANLPFNDKLFAWIKELLSSILSLCILYYCVAKISKPTQNYNLIFMFVSAMILPYVLPFALYMFLPSIGKIEGIKKLIDEGKISDKYFSEEYAYSVIYSTLYQLFYELGIGILMMLFIKKLIRGPIFFLNYFLKNIFKFFITCLGMAFLEKLFNAVYIIPFCCGMLLYCQKISKGELTNRFKEEPDMD